MTDKEKQMKLHEAILNDPIIRVLKDEAGRIKFMATPNYIKTYGNYVSVGYDKQTEEMLNSIGQLIESRTESIKTFYER